MINQQTSELPAEHFTQEGYWAILCNQSNIATPETPQRASKSDQKNQTPQSSTKTTTNNKMDANTKRSSKTSSPKKKHHQRQIY